MKTNNVLVVDSDPAMLKTLVGLLESHGGFLHISTANSGKAALELIEGCPFAMVITSLRLSATEGIDGFELITRITQSYPEIKVILMTSGDTCLLQAKIEGIPEVVHLDQALDIRMLTNRVFTELQIDYGGRVRGIHLSSFLQMMELEARTCTLNVSSKGNSGTLWLTDGEVIAASSGSQRGQPAALQIIAWRNVSIDIDYSEHNMEREIFVPTMMLILESNQIEDEARSQNANQRQYVRYELLVAIDYNIGEMKRHCSLKDISVAGAYIETDHTTRLDQIISLTLTSPRLKTSCTIEAKIVRQDAGGVGVIFQPHNSRQHQIVRALIRDSLKLESSLNQAPAHTSQPPTTV